MKLVTDVQHARPLHVYVIYCAFAFISLIYFQGVVRFLIGGQMRSMVLVQVVAI